MDAGNALFPTPKAPPADAIKLLQSLVGKQPRDRGQHIQDFIREWGVTKEEAEGYLQ